MTSVLKHHKVVPELKMLESRVGEIQPVASCGGVSSFNNCPSCMLKPHCSVGSFLEPLQLLTE